MNHITERVRKLRKEMTAAEKIFWSAVRYRTIGFTFHRQKPIRFHNGNLIKYFVADFFCRELKLVVEIDGKVHENQKEYDENRTYIINQLGYRVIRFTNQQVFTNVKSCISQLLALPSPPVMAREGGSPKGETDGASSDEQAREGGFARAMTATDSDHKSRRKSQCPTWARCDGASK